MYAIKFYIYLQICGRGACYTQTFHNPSRPVVSSQFILTDDLFYNEIVLRHPLRNL